MDEVREQVESRMGRRVPAVFFGLLAMLVGFGSVAAACVTHTAAGGNHHEVVATDCNNTGCPNPPDLVGNDGGGGILPPQGSFHADGGSTVVSTVQLAIADGGTCVGVVVRVCTSPTPGQTDTYEIRSASSISNCNTTTSSTVESGGHLGRNFVATWTVPTTTGNYHACVAPTGVVPAFSGTHVPFTVY